MAAAIPITATSVAGFAPAVLRWYSTAVLPDTDRVVIITSPRGASVEAFYCSIRESFIVEDFAGDEVLVTTSMWREL